MKVDTSPATSVLREGAVLLYDGECGVCSRAVQWVLSHERKHSLRFAPLGSSLGQKLIDAAGLPAEIDSVLWMEEHGGKIRARIWAGAVFATLRYVGGPWRVLLLFQIVPRPILDACYRLFAKHRQNVAPKACFLPPRVSSGRFLDA